MSPPKKGAQSNVLFTLSFTCSHVPPPVQKQADSLAAECILRLGIDDVDGAVLSVALALSHSRSSWNGAVASRLVE